MLLQFQETQSFFYPIIYMTFKFLSVIEDLCSK